MWGIEMFESSRENFLFVIRNIWLQDFDDRVVFTDDTEKCSVMAITALANAWDIFSWSSASQIHEAVRLARCTVSAALHVDYFNSARHRSYDFKQTPMTPGRRTIAPRLAKSLGDTANRARDAIVDPDLVESNESGRLTVLVELLEVLSHTIGSQLESNGGEITLRGSTKPYNDWEALRKILTSELDTLDPVEDPIPGYHVADYRRGGVVITGFG
ncbi:hypothetical protein B0H14DRAFT_2841613 [Mycena olivaceomarginata]|nr:hypothetical protein B0H14DRAFT_2841613 [Mycena olivaceomarginata]